MKIEFSNREYIYEHGKAPKGFGHWYFTFEGMGRWEFGTDYGETVYVNIEP